jgi:hypothetical protein
MKKLLLLAILILNLTNSFGQSLKRNIGESAKKFVERILITKNSKITGKVIETKWNSETAIFAFVAVEEIQKNGTEQYVETNVEGFVFIPISENLYRKVLIDSYGEEGAVAEIESIFFSNADKDKQKELIVLCSWDQNRHASPISGKLYQVWVYDNIILNKIPDKLKSLNDLQRLFAGEFDGTNDAGESSKAKYTNAAKIKQRLKQLGF